MNPVSSKFKQWRKDPISAVRELFKAEPDHWQKEGLLAFVSEDRAKFRISLQACAGPGKSALLAWCGWLFLLCYGNTNEHPKGACVSVTRDNLRDNLWPEFAKWQSRSPLLLRLFTWTKSRIYANDHPETWFLSARSWSKTADAEEQGRTLSGLHSQYVLYLIDESGEIPLPVLKAAEQGLSNCTFGKIMQAGNPTSLEGMLYAAATRLRDQWHIIIITGDPEDPKRSNRIDKEWAADMISRYGRDDPWVMSLILGQFPPSSLNSLLGPDEVQAAMYRRIEPEAYAHFQKRLGVDVARFGDDRTCFAPRQGLMAHPFAIMRGARTDEIASRLAVAKHKWGSEVEFIDDTGGWAGGVVDNCRLAGINVSPINFSGKATDPRYFNIRAEMWFRMAEWVKNGGSLPNDNELAKELVAPTYTFNNGKFLLEAKDQIKKRLGFSPDKADSLALTFAYPDQASNTSILHKMLDRQASKLQCDFDPFDDKRA